MSKPVFSIEMVIESSELILILFGMRILIPLPYWFTGSVYTPVETKNNSPLPTSYRELQDLFNITSPQKLTVLNDDLYAFMPICREVKSPGRPWTKRKQLYVYVWRINEATKDYCFSELVGRRRCHRIEKEAAIVNYVLNSITVNPFRSRQ